MTKSTIENIEGMDTVNIEGIPIDNLKNMLKGIDKEIEKLEKDRLLILCELERRGEKIPNF